MSRFERVPLVPADWTGPAEIGDANIADDVSVGEVLKDRSGPGNAEAYWTLQNLHECSRHFKMRLNQKYILNN